MTIRILLADDHRILREGLRSLLEKEKEMTVVAETEDGRSTVEWAQKLTPDVIVMDVGMDGLNGIDATRRIASLCPDVKVLALSMHRDNQLVGGMLTAGASGYLLKDCAAEELSLAIRAVVAGETYLSPAISKVLVEEYVARLSRRGLSASSALRGEQREILQLLAEGKTSKEIASCLGLSIRSVEAHRREIKQKLGIHTTAGLTKYAMRKGITSMDGE
jgi:DNA-binding NarL/FixJ family response regulator